MSADSISILLTAGGAALAICAAVQGLWETLSKQRSLSSRIAAAKLALGEDRSAGDEKLPRLRAALGREHITWDDVLWLPEFFALSLAVDEFRSLRIQSVLVSLGVVLSTIGAVVSASA